MNSNNNFEGNPSDFYIDDCMEDILSCLGKCKESTKTINENVNFWVDQITNDGQKSSKDIMRKPRSVKDIDWLL